MEQESKSNTIQASTRTNSIKKDYIGTILKAKTKKK